MQIILLIKETGSKVKCSKCESVFVVYPSVLGDESDLDAGFDEMEDLQMRKLALGDAVEMVMRGEITDAISVAALLRIAAQKIIRADTT